MINDNLKNLIKQGSVELSTTKCLNCLAPFVYKHTIRLLCLKCWSQSPEAKSQKAAYARIYYSKNKEAKKKYYVKYKNSKKFAKSRLRTALKLFNEIKEMEAV
ncbi:hypothetical protein HYW42_05665 [Candidatus Daviesbacteria bacterium]|nr:hypothetical protein [Candidatus Daviesbacteria bacterium]